MSRYWTENTHILNATVLSSLLASESSIQISTLTSFSPGTFLCERNPRTGHSHRSQIQPPPPAALRVRAASYRRRWGGDIFFLMEKNAPPQPASLLRICFDGPCDNAGGGNQRRLQYFEEERLLVRVALGRMANKAQLGF